MKLVYVTHTHTLTDSCQIWCGAEDELITVQVIVQYCDGTLPAVVVPGVVVSVGEGEERLWVVQQKQVATTPRRHPHHIQQVLNFPRYYDLIFEGNFISFPQHNTVVLLKFSWQTPIISNDTHSFVSIFTICE